MAIELTTTYLGLELANPLVASAGPMTETVESMLALEQAGVAAVVLPSLFEEQIEHEQSQVQQLFDYQTESFAEALSHFPEVASLDVGPSACLKRIEEAKRRLSIPVIASLNGHSPGGWTHYAKAMQSAGADALELNVYYVPTDCDMESSAVEQQYLDLVASVRSVVTIPLSVKVGSQFSSIPNMARRLMAAGADGLVLFNRFFEPDIDLPTLTITPDLILSKRNEMRLPLRWISILRDQLTLSLAATSGVHRTEDMIKMLLVGADVTMATATFLRHGPGYASTMIDELYTWLDENHYTSVEQMKGSLSYANCPDPGALERANYMRALKSYTPDMATE